MLPTLQSPRLLLDAFTLDDAPSVQRQAGDPEVARTTANIPHPYPEGAAEAWIGSHAPAFAEKRHVTLAIRHPEHGLVGTVSLGVDMAHRHAEAGYWIGREFWSQGFATEALRRLIAYGFRELDLERIHARHLGCNPASGRVMEKAGMTREGCQRRHFIKNGNFEDVVLYGIMRSDAPESA
jgi:ribosomal-protein-alanine N-acetyltransferase